MKTENNKLELFINLLIVMGVIFGLIWYGFTKEDQKYENNLTLVRFNICDNITIMDSCNCSQPFEKQEYTGKDAVFLNCKYEYDFILLDKNRKVIKQFKFKPSKHENNLIKVDGYCNRFDKIPLSKD